MSFNVHRRQRRRRRQRRKREKSARGAEGGIPTFEYRILIDDTEDVRSTEENFQRSTSSDSEEDEQLQPIDHRGDVLPVISNLERRKGNRQASARRRHAVPLRSGKPIACDWR